MGGYPSDNVRDLLSCHHVAGRITSQVWCALVRATGDHRSAEGLIADEC